MYNVTAIAGTANQTGLFSVVEGVSTHILDGWLMTIFIMGFWVVLVGSFMYVTDDIKKAVATSSYLCLMISIFSVGLNLMSPLIIFIFGLLSALATATLFRR